MRSGMTVWRVGCSSSTPSTAMVELPAPDTRAPMPTRKSARSPISGSRAALSMTVVPLASTAAVNAFSVAPTLGNSSRSVEPISRSAVASM